MSADAERAAAFVASWVRRKGGSRWLCGPRKPPLSPRTGGEAIGLFATRHLFRIAEPVGRALVAWDRGDAIAHCLDRVPTPREVLALQARGERCVSLLDDGAATGPHEDPLAFAVHDLCHLEKFVDGDHFVSQVGFFYLCDRALASPRWDVLERSFDDTWVADRDHVISDMNGSAVFLFLALKNKLKLAVRRTVAREQSLETVPRGPLGPRESSVYAGVLEELFTLFDFDAELRTAARAVSSREDAAVGAPILLAHWESVGAERAPPAGGGREGQPDER